MQISLLGPISLYVVMMVEIRNRQMFASFKSWIHESLELDMRRQSLWKVCCELLLAVILTRQILGNWYDHLCRAKLSEQW